MPQLSFEEWASIAGAIFSLLALGYSVLVLVRTRKNLAKSENQGALPRTSSVSMEPIDPRHPLFYLLGLTVPDVQKLLAKHPKQIYLQFHATSEGIYEAIFVGQMDTSEDRVVIDLAKRKSIVPLIEGLSRPVRFVKGGSIWLKRTHRKKPGEGVVSTAGSEVSPKVG